MKIWTVSFTATRLAFDKEEITLLIAHCCRETGKACKCTSDNKETMGVAGFGQSASCCEAFVFFTSSLPLEEESETFCFRGEVGLFNGEG